MATIVFKRAANGLPYFLSDGQSIINRSIAYLHGESNTSDTISISDAWNRFHGVYLILNRPVDDEANFSNTIRACLADPALRNAGLLWIYNANDIDQGLNADILKFNWQVDGSAQIAELKIFNFRNLALTIGEDCSIGFNNTTSSIEINKPVTDNQRIYLLNRIGAQRVFQVGTKVTIPLLGNSAGCLQFQVTINEALLDDLDAGLRYFYDDQSYQNYGYLTSQRYPIFNNASSGILFTGNLDPLNHLNIDRSYFAFNSDSSQLPIQSYFRTNLGQSIQLTPQADARLVLQVKSTTQTINADDPYYLTPAGSFLVTIPGNNITPANNDIVKPSRRFMCGSSGIEYLGLMDYANNILHFLPNMPAYASGYQPQAESTTNNDNDDSNNIEKIDLINAATTAWLFVTPPSDGTINYYAQPEDAIQYRADDPDFLRLLEIYAGTLPDELKKDGGTVTAFPMVAYTGIKDGKLNIIRDLEQLVISPARRQQIYQLTAAELAKQQNSQGNAVIGVTPQGFYSQFDIKTEYWRSIILAQSDQGAQQLQLSNITGLLRAALQTNQLFLVISSKDKFLQYCSVTFQVTEQALADLKFQAKLPDANLTSLATIQDTLYQNRDSFLAKLQTILAVGDLQQYAEQILEFCAQAKLTIRDWDFDLSPYIWDNQGTILIFKFHDRAMIDLINDQNGWFNADEFNDSSFSTQSQLQSIISDAQTSNSADFDYLLNQVINNKEWNGILIFNCEVPLTELPPQMEGLAAGIDAANFYAHHFGINITPVNYHDGKLQINDSSLFGLINYQDNTDTFVDGDYQFKVRSLKVLFQNSAITSFSSELLLMINRLFGEASTLTSSQFGNILSLYGVYQRHDQHDSYVFIRQSQDVFQLQSHVLDNVEIDKAQFITIIPPNNLQPGQNVQTKFIFWGKLRFLAMPGFDLFSFGSLYQSNGVVSFDGGLSYSNLSIDMVFNPEQAGSQQFSFNAGQVAIDMARSNARPDSLYNHFPLKFSAMVAGKEGVTPKDAGYLDVDAPLAQGSIGYPWYGLEFTLNLGSMGALAGKSDFSAMVIAAWAANNNDYSIYIGIKLPGETGANRLFSIQNILKLNIASIEFTVSAGNVYMMKFNDIGLKVFMIKFPRTGQTNLILFGDPEGVDRTTLGWYAAYVNRKDINLLS